jgi:hypothetical protein
VKERFVVYGAQKEDVEPTYHAVLTDHPELFWVDGSTSFTYYELGSTMTISPGFSIPADQVEDVRTRIEGVADEFIASLPAGVDDYGIAKAAYEFVINTTDYDANASQNQNIQSVFLYHASVCAGYSRAFQYLLQRAGVYCSFVEGEIPSSGEEPSPSRPIYIPGRRRICCKPVRVCILPSSYSTDAFSSMIFFSSLILRYKLFL